MEFILEMTPQVYTMQLSIHVFIDSLFIFFQMIYF
jgi:hypothetical protein